MTFKEHRVAVIGAGASGLPAIKCCLDEGLTPVCFEKSDGIGGLWRYTEKPQPGRAGVYRSTTINSSKELLAYSTFPPPADFPNFMHHSKLYEYMLLYAKQYSLAEHIQFNMEVVSVEKDLKFEDNGKWRVKIRKCGSSIIKIEKFDAVMVCTGHHAFPNDPSEYMPGKQEFKGKTMHGHDYRDHQPFAKRRVMVVGLGNTGGDLAAELSRHAEKLLLSTRRGAWVVNRIAHRGLPYDTEVVTRFFHYCTKVLPTSLLNWMYELKMNLRFDHQLYGLKPEHRIMSQHPLVNDELPARIANGSITVVPDIISFYDGGVVTKDGVHHDVDDVIFATGYKIRFPFLSDEVLTVDERNKPKWLYKHVFPLSIAKKPTLAVIGNVQPLGGLMPIAEMQSRWATRVFKSLVKLPSMEDMSTEVTTRSALLQERYVKSSRHTIQVDYADYMDSVAEEIGVKPNLARLVLSEPQLAWNVLMGPATSYQYRLHGPGRYEGARDAIIHQWKRIRRGYGARASTTDSCFFEDIEKSHTAGIESKVLYKDTLPLLIPVFAISFIMFLMVCLI